MLDNNSADGTANDIYVSGVNSAGLMDIKIHDAGDTVEINSGIGGDGILNLTGPGTVALNVDGHMGVTNVNSGTLRLNNDSRYDNSAFTLRTEGALSGQGTVTASGAGVGGMNIFGLLDPDDGATGYGILTLDATGSAIAMSGFSMEFDITTPTTRGPDGRPTNQQDLLVVKGPQVDSFGGTVDFRTHAGFQNGKYLVILSDNGFDLGGNPLDGINNANGVLKGTLDGFEIGSDRNTPRQYVEFVYGDNNTNEIWLNNALNSLTMDWTGGGAGTVANPIGGAWAGGQDRMESAQVLASTGNREHQFLPGDKVHISGDADLTVSLQVDGQRPTTPTVSGLVIGQTSAGTDRNGNVTIDGLGGITADEDSPFGVYLDPATAGGQPVLEPTGKLEKYGTGTLTFENAGDNLFKQGIELYGGITAFNRAEQLAVGTGAVLSFEADAVLRADASLAYATQMVVQAGATGTLHTEDGIGMFLDGNVGGPGNLAKTGGGIVQFSEDAGGSTLLGYIADTTVEAGKFRIVDGKTYTSTGTFALEKGAELSGGGTVVANEFSIDGTIAADKAVMTPENMVVAGDDRFATLTLTGTNAGTSTVEFHSTVVGMEREGFVFDYRVRETNTIGSAPPTNNDLLSITGMNSVQLEGGVINFMTDAGSLTTGDYLIIDSNVEIEKLGGGSFASTDLDGINNPGTGALWGKINGEDIRAGGPRGSFEFSLQNGAADRSQLWLTVSHNTLQTVWQGGSGKWNTNGWLSVQVRGGEQDKNFFDGDLAYFNDDFSADYTVTVDRDVIVSGVDVDTAGDIAFDGAGGIVAYTKPLDHSHDDYLVGDYIVYDGVAPVPANQEFNATGALAKRGAGTLTLSNTGTNFFEQGTEIYQGTIILSGTEADRLGKYAGTTPDNDGLVTFKNDNAGLADAAAKTVVVATAQTLQNRYVVEANVTNAAITANADAEISGVVNAGTDGGAVHIGEDAVLTFNAIDGDITLKNNSLNNVATPNDIYLDSGATSVFHLENGKNVFIDSGIASEDATSTVSINGAGRVQIASAAANNGFTGTTNVDSAGLRVVGGTTYGGTGNAGFSLGTLDAFDVPDNDDAYLEGDGTIRSNQFTIGGHVSPDKYDLRDPTAENSVGRLTLEGTGANASVIFKSAPDPAYPAINDRTGFHFDYDAVAPNSLANTQAGVTDAEKDPDATLNDLLSITGMTTVTLEGGVVNFVVGADGLKTGRYLLIDSDTTITDKDGNRFADGQNGGGGGLYLDGINDYTTNEGVLWAKLNGTDIRPDNPRADRRFYFDSDSANGMPLDSQIWLEIDRNTLKVDWNGADGVWTADGLWTSEQYAEIGVDKYYDHTFNNGDYVVFDGGGYTVTIPESVIVSGMDANPQNAGDIVTFDGAGGITAIKDNPAGQTYIEGRYANAPDTTLGHFDTTGTLEKTGAGTLVFRNTGGNDFTEGINLHGGVTAFNFANQLGNKVRAEGDQQVGSGNDVNFVESATLRADASATTYNDMDVAAGKTATLEASGAGTVWGYAGALTGDATTTVAKTGAGTLNLYDHLEFDVTENKYLPTPSAYAGFVDVAAGTLGVYGDYGSTNGFEVKSGAVLTGTGSIGSRANDGIIRSGGRLAPGGLSKFTSAGTAPIENPLTVVGDLTFEAGSNFDVRITQFGVGADGKYNPYSDRVDVTNGGVVTINKGSILNVDMDYWGGTLDITDYNARKSGYFTIIDASDGSARDLAAKFDLNLLQHLPRGVVMEQGWNVYSGDEYFQLWFGIDPDNGFNDVCDKYNRVQIGGNLDQLVWNIDPGLKDLIDHLSDPSLTDPELCLIIDWLTGDLVANSLEATLKKPWRQPFARLDSLLEVCRDPDPERSLHPRAADADNNIWAQYYGRHAKADYDSNAHGYKVNRNGLVIGYDRWLGNSSVLGFAFNYSEPRVRQNTGKTEIEDYEFGLYNLTLLPGQFELKLYAGYSHQRYDFDRRVHIPAVGQYPALSERFRNKVSGHALAGSVEVMRPFCLNPRFTLRPVAALDYEQAWIKAHRETGGLTALDYERSNLMRLEARVGLQADYAILDKLGVTARVQYAHQLNNPDYSRVKVRFANAATPQTAATIRGVKLGRDYVNLGAGVDLKLNRARTVSLFLRYDADIYKNLTQHTGEVGLSFQW